ncbi:MAG TPA: arylamine N-acetyltransferase [Acidimicrobiia bacterium]|nr:arylamine N-acetyltransferase [Acidimicrobiia bacterium]
MIDPMIDVDAILERLGLGARPAPDLDGLARVYLAWCRNVPFDNVVKRVHMASGDTGPIPNGPPDAFFDWYLRHGTGGTCWPSANALHALLVGLGFDARRGSAAMADSKIDGEYAHSHGTTLVRVDGTDHWVDTSMLTDRVLPLARGATTSIPGPVHPLRAEPVGDRWRVWWEPGPRGQEMSCLLLSADTTSEHYLARYEFSRGWSPFNLWVHAVRNTERGRLTLTNGTRYERRADGGDTRALDVGDRTKVLVEEFGYSEEIVARLPPDEAPPVPSKS